MPLYDYRCDLCHSQFEVRQSFSDDRLTVCPQSGGPAECQAPGEGPVKKVFSGVGISFKGDGFYKNDFGANAKQRRKERKESSSSSGSSDSSKGSSDSKTAKSSSSGSSGKSSDYSKKATAGAST